MSEKYKKEGKRFLIAATVFLIIAIVLFCSYIRKLPIEREDAVVYEGIVKDTDPNGRLAGRHGIELDNIDVVFEDGSEYRIGSALITDRNFDPLEAELLKLKGEKIRLLYNKKANCILEITYGSRELLNFDESREKLHSNGRSDLFFAIINAAIFLTFLICGIVYIALGISESKYYSPPPRYY